ncbi:MAG TPA: hypothetical protein VI298_08765 [Geobacteraceae bacterium]
MKRSSGGARRLLAVMWLLSNSALTGCQHAPPALLHDSAAMRIHRGDLPRSPEAEGWLISDNALAKILEAAEAYRSK